MKPTETQTKTQDEVSIDSTILTMYLSTPSVRQDAIEEALSTKQMSGAEALLTMFMRLHE
jgi:hypothetical protein